MSVKRVLFLCTGNSARSQMAEALLRDLGGDAVEVTSAGIEPKGLHSLAVKAMSDIGIDISGQKSKGLDAVVGQPLDFVITVCDNANESCPIFPGDTERVHWSFEDPAAAQGSDEERLRVFRRVRDELLVRLRLFVLAQHIGQGAQAATQRARRAAERPRARARGPLP